MTQYDIKITGSGSHAQIIQRLFDLLKDLCLATEGDLIDYVNEDETLYTEIEELDPEEIED